MTSRALKKNPHFRTKEILGTTHMIEYHSAVKGPSTDMHDIMADPEGFISMTPITCHCRERQNYWDKDIDATLCCG